MNLNFLFYIYFIPKKLFWGVPFVTQWLTNPASIHEDAGSIPGLGFVGYGSGTVV